MCGGWRGGDRISAGVIWLARLFGCWVWQGVDLGVYAAVGVEFATNGLNGHTCGVRRGNGASAEFIANLLCLGSGDLRVVCFRRH